MTNLKQFHSLIDLKERHRLLLMTRRDLAENDETAVSAYLHDITNFIDQGSAAGAFLQNDDDRHEAQNLLDYWANELFHKGCPPQDSTLAEFDINQAPLLPDALCPYVGLDAFSTQNGGIFYGRSRLIEDMINRLDNGRFIAVTGPSGCGKSSAVLAGLIPRLQEGILPGSDAWRYPPRTMPGSHPLQNLARLFRPPGALTTDWVQENTRKFQENPHHLAHLVNSQHKQPVVLIIDQFEELFTLCQDEETRQIFIDNLLNLAQDGKTRHTLIITMRTDYESQLMRIATFQRAYEQAQIRVRPMNAAQLHEVIEKPAAQIGLHFEEGLITELIRDILGEPNALPLLQFTLLKLWEMRDHNRVTWTAYEQLGGGRQALANSANACYTQLAPQDREIARQILLATIYPGPGLEIARQRVRRITLYHINESSERLNSVLDRLISARLIRLTRGDTPDDDQIELTHEALVASWPRFIGWLEEERVTRRHRARLAESAEEWAQRGHDPSVLWRGMMLEEASEYLDKSELETAFIQASQQAEQKAQEEKAQAYIIQLEQARALAKAERLRAEEQQLRAEEQSRFAAENAAIAQRLQRITWALAGVAIIAILAGAWAAINGQRASQNAVIAAENAVLAATSEAAALQNAALAATHEAEAVANANLAATREAEAVESASLAATSEAIAIAAASIAATSEAQAVANADLAAVRETEARLSALEADRQFRLASSRELARAATDNLESAPQLALLLAVEAVNTTFAIDQTASAEAEDALYRTLRAAQLQFTLSGHDGPVTAVAFNSAGTRLATGSADTTLKLWDAATGQNYLTLEDHQEPVTDVIFSDDDTRVISADEDGLIKVWDAETGRLLFTRTGDNGAVNALALSPDGAQLATANEDATVRVWDTTIWTSPFLSFGHIDAVADVAYNSTGAQLASAGVDGRIILWNALTGASLNAIEPTLNEQGEIQRINAIDYNPDDTLIAAASDNIVRLLAVETGRVQDILAGHTETVNDITFNPDGDVLATASADGTVKLWRVDSGQAIDTLPGHLSGVLSVAFSPDGLQLATSGQSGLARVWNAEPEFEQIILTEHLGAVRRIRFNGDGSLAATAGADRTARVWDAQTGSSLHVFTDHNQVVNDVAFSPDALWLASASDDFNVRLWNLETGEVRVPLLIHQAAVNSVVFSRDGAYLLTSSDDGIARLWDVAESRVVQQFDHDGVGVNRAVLSPDGLLAATAVADGTVRLWNLATGQLLQTMSEHELPVNDVAFDATGSYLASASDDGTARLWNLETGDAIRTFSGHVGPVLGVSFNQDGSRLATASSDRTTRLWNVATGQTARTLLDHTSSVLSVSYSPNGRYLATASADSTAVIQEVNDLAELFQRGLTRQRRSLTAEECRQYLHGRPCFTAGD